MALFITFEGGEGAGKTTLLSRIQTELKKQGHKVLTTREPGGTELGEKIRQWLLDPAEKAVISARTELCLFLAARAQHLQEKIEPALKQGKIVLCDRFNDSTIAYQGAGRGLGMQEVGDMCRFVCGSLQPSLTFYLDVEPSVGLERARGTSKEAAAGQLDKIESEALAFHQMIRQAFLQLAKEEPHRIQVIDAHQTPHQVFQQVIRIILERINPEA